MFRDRHKLINIPDNQSSTINDIRKSSKAWLLSGQILFYVVRIIPITIEFATYIRLQHSICIGIYQYLYAINWNTIGITGSFVLVLSKRTSFPHFNTSQNLFEVIFKECWNVRKIELLTDRWHTASLEEGELCCHRHLLSAGFIYFHAISTC